MLQAMKENGYEVYAVVHRNDPGVETGNRIKGGIKVLDHQLIDKINPELIIHCARPSYPRFRRFGRLFSAHIAARLNSRLIAELQKTSSRPLLVFSSGSLVYGNSDVAHEEKISVNPVSYARQYYGGEKPFSKAVSRSTYPVLIFRLPWLFGAGSWFRWFYLKPMMEKHCIPLFRSGDNTMEIIDIRDAVSLMLLLSYKGNTGVINIPGSVRLTQLAFARSVSSMFGYPLKDYTEVFKGTLEKEAVEAFTSNILVTSKFTEEISSFNFRSIEESLQSIRKSM